MITDARPRTSSGPQLVYYAGWVAMFLIEAVTWATLGIGLGIAVFVLGGIVWSRWQARQTRPGEALRGPILHLTKRLLDRGGAVAFLGALVVGAPPGVAAAAASSDRDDIERLIVVANVLYAVLCVTFHVLRPQGRLPIHFGPTLPGR